MHFTRASPGSIEDFRKNRKFVDGTELVKEVFGTARAQMTTGDAHWASGIQVWFVMIKDAKGRYPGNPLCSEDEFDRVVDPAKMVRPYVASTN
jgi:hypothetical protein